MEAKLGKRAVLQTRSWIAMRSGILRTYIATLRLRADAPFPSQLKGRARKFLRLRLV